MRDEAVPVFDKNEEVITNLLVNIGLKRNMAKTLVYLANVDEAISRRVEMGAGLRQPEVSIAMRELRDKGWIDEWEKKKEGKGRPLKCYKLAIRLNDIIDFLEEEKRREARQDEERIERLRYLSTGIEK
jgi:predicted transcriptional regulator